MKWKNTRSNVEGSYVVSHSLYRAKRTTIAEVRVYYPKKRWAACSKGWFVRCGSTVFSFLPKHAVAAFSAISSQRMGFEKQGQVPPRHAASFPFKHTNLKEGQMNMVYLKITACPSGKHLLLQGRPEPCLDHWACAARPASADRFSAHPEGTGNLRQSSRHLSESWTSLCIGSGEILLQLKDG